MPNVYFIRAEFGKYASDFLQGGYAALGTLNDRDLSKVKTKEQLYDIYREENPDETSNNVIGAKVGVLARFLFELRAGDYLLTRGEDAETLYWGTVADNQYEYAHAAGSCPFRHRRHVQWHAEAIHRSDLSVPFQHHLRSLLSLFKVSYEEEFFTAINVTPKGTKKALASGTTYDPYTPVIDRMLSLTATEFELLTIHLLDAMGFEGTQHTGKSGDKGIDAFGTLTASGLIRVRLYVQAKRYKANQVIDVTTVKNFRGSIPKDAQGAFIATCAFHKKAYEEASREGFTPVTLINGRQLVDLLAEHWAYIPEEVQEQLALKQGLFLK